jgi:cytochrome bd-type quinol oxidase subunit 2
MGDDVGTKPKKLLPLIITLIIIVLLIAGVATIAYPYIFTPLDAAIERATAHTGG